jgi:glutamine amidotransferase
MRIALVDVGLGNRRSVHKALEHVGARVYRAETPEALAGADGLVLPGVGAFGEAMRRLEDTGLDQAVKAAVADGTPLLGLCLGMQLLFERSSELGETDGLALLGGGVDPLAAHGLKLPHIGWSALLVDQPTHPLMAGLPNPLALYHVHSFVAAPADPSIVLATGDYGATFPSIVASGPVMGAQCHPEKSSRDGLRLLANFVSICAARTSAVA